MTDLRVEIPKSAFGKAKTALGLFVGLFVAWGVLSILRSHILWYWGGKYPEVAVQWSIASSLFTIEICFLSCWLVVDLFRYWENLYSGHFKGGAIGGVSRAILAFVISSVLSVLLYSILKPEDGRRYHTGVFSKGLMSETAKDHFLPRHIDELGADKRVSEKGRAAADAAFIAQLLTISLFLLYWYIRFCRRELNQQYASPIEEVTMSSLFMSIRPRGGGMQ